MLRLLMAACLRFEERLPDNPFVVTAGVYLSVENLPELKIGKYRRTMRMAHAVANWNRMRS